MANIKLSGGFIMKFIKQIALTAIILAGLAFSFSGTKPTPVEAAITSSYLRITVVRPSWWDDDSNWQVLRVADSDTILNNNTYASITYYSIESYVSDTYYNVGAGGFGEYDCDGVVFYDVPISSISGKYIDLARLSTNDPATATVNNKTTAEVYTLGLNNRLWRIWNNPAGDEGIYRPEGESAESRNVSNAVISSLLYGYLTCSANVSNGYLAYPALNANYNLSGRTYLETDTVLDFVSVDDYAAGRGTGVTVEVSDKVAAMAVEYAASQSSGFISTTIDNAKDNYLLLATLGTIAVLISVAFLAITKKRQST